MNQVFQVGETVYHFGHGAGQVVSAAMKKDEQSVVVKFSDGRLTSLMSNFLSRDQMSAAAQLKEAQAQLKSRPRKAANTSVQPYPMTWFDDIDPNIHKEWTVEDWMGEGELLVPYGAPGCGKSVLIGDMVCHIAADRPWFGQRVKRAAILYVAAERANLVLRRFAAFRKHHDVHGLPLVVIKGYFDLAKAGTDTDRVIATVKELVEQSSADSSIVVIDTKRQVIGDENSDDVGKLVGNIARIQDETGSGIIVIDHTPFHSPTKPAGRGELLAAADATFLLEKGADVRTFQVKKANDGPDDVSFAFDLTSVELGTHPVTGKVTTAPVVVPADMPEATHRTAGRLTPSEKIALAALEEAVLEGGEKRASSRVPANARAVTVSLWREYAYKRGISDAESPDAKKKAFKRARMSPLSKNRIGTWGEDVWLAGETPDISGLIASKGTRDIEGTL